MGNGNAIPAPSNYLVRPLSRENGFLRFSKLPAASFHAPPYVFPQKTWFLAIPSLGPFSLAMGTRGGVLIQPARWKVPQKPAISQISGHLTAGLTIWPGST